MDEHAEVNPQGVGEEDKQAKAKEYQAKYYREHRKKLSKQRAARYEADTPHRERIKVRALARYKKQRAKIEEEHRRTGWKPKKRGYNRPRVMQIAGKDVLLHSPLAFADAAGISLQTLGAWEDRGVLPPPTIRDEKGRRWYSETYMNRVVPIVRAYKDKGGFRLDPLKKMFEEALAKNDAK